MAGGLPTMEVVCCSGSVFLWRQHVHSVLRTSDLWVASRLVLPGPRS